MLSIVYITCNRSSELEKSIRSCEACVSIDHEYVVIDNGSTDNTPATIRKLIDEGLTINYCMQETNRGVSGGRNIGFNVARGDVCYFIDDDATIVTEGLVLDSAYQYMINHPEIFAMGTDAYDTERKTNLVGCRSKASTLEDFYPIRNYIGCSHFVRKDAVKTPYLYPDNLMYGSEELYAGLSFIYFGGTAVQYNQMKILHEPSNKTRSSMKERQRNGYINTYVIKKYFLPFPYKVASNFLFHIRLLKFEKLSLKKVFFDMMTAKKRYDEVYKKTLDKRTIRHLIREYGLTKIL